MKPLLCKTRKPIIYSTFEFGGDDLLGYAENFIDINNFLRKKIIYLKEMIQISHFQSIDNIENEYEIAKKQLFEYVNEMNKNDVTYLIKYKEIEDRVLKSSQIREKIVDALGGIDFCSKIIAIDSNKIPLKSYLDFPFSLFPENESIIQFEDLAGRKGFVMKLIDKNDHSIFLRTFHQRYRETCAPDFGTGGNLWIMNCKCEKTEKIIPFIESIMNNSNENYKLADVK